MHSDKRKSRTRQIIGLIGVSIVAVAAMLINVTGTLTNPRVELATNAHAFGLGGIGAIGSAVTKAAQAQAQADAAKTATEACIQEALDAAREADENIAEEALTEVATKAATECAAAAAASSVSGRKVSYVGYSKGFQKTKKLLADGKAEKAYERQIKTLKKKKKKKKDEEAAEEASYRSPNYLFALEQGVISLDANKREEAIAFMDEAENILDIRDERGAASGFFQAAGTGTGKLLGFGEAGEYRGESFERILMLNYKSIAYMLDGERRAYNVTRRAISWQNEEKRAFDQYLAEVKAKIAEEQEVITEAEQSKADEGLTEEEIAAKRAEEAAKKAEEAAAQAAVASLVPGLGGVFSAVSLLSVLDQQYEASREKALQVPNAFVNPFGFYMAGIVQEYDSFEDRSLRDNARISYEKALELRPDSAVIKTAIEDINKPAPKGKRLVQVILSDGFAPEKKVLRFDYSVSGSNVAVKLPIYEPHPSDVARAVLMDKEGNELAEFDLIADIDALALRYEYDSLPVQHLNLMVTIARQVLENKALDKLGMFGTAVKMGKDSISNPDMRSWMTLPKKVLASRVYVPEDMGEVVLMVYDVNGDKLSEQEITLNTEHHNFVYARSINDTLYLDHSDELWAPVL